MGWLSSILRALAPIAVEHGSQVLRESFKARTGQGPGQASGTDADVVQQLASDIDQIKRYALQLKSEIDTLNDAVASREDRLRRWLLALVIWNVVMTIGLVVIGVLAFRR